MATAKDTIHAATRPAQLWTGPAVLSPRAGISRGMLTDRIPRHALNGLPCEPGHRSAAAVPLRRRRRALQQLPEAVRFVGQAWRQTVVRHERGYVPHRLLGPRTTDHPR